jgi:proteasome component ECM29
VKFLVEKEKALEMKKESASAKVIDNPWANINDSVPSEIKEMKKDIIGADSLSRSLLPLLWKAARRNQPKSSRLASARWTSDLLLRLDNSSAFHLLCFLSGDDDATVSMIAKQGLGVDKSMGEDNILSIDSISPSSEQDGRVAFSVLMSVIVGSNSSMNSWPTYSSFPVIARAVTLRFLLQSLFSEVNFYGDDNDGLALKEFVVLILSTLATYKGRTLSREETDLIDECAIALACLTSTSKDARSVVAERDWVADGQFSFGDIPKQAMSSSSSKARVSDVSLAIYCLIQYCVLTFYLIATCSDIFQNPWVTCMKIIHYGLTLLQPILFLFPNGSSEVV